MSHIIQTAGTRLDITANSLLAISYKINVAQSTLRAAGVAELPDICLCPAIKLVRSVQLLESHGIEVPEEIAIIAPPTTLTDLPNELLSQICDLVYDDICEEMTQGDYYRQVEDEILTGEAYKPVRILIAAQKNIGLTSRLRSIVLDRCISQLQHMSTDWTSLANVLGYGRPFYNNTFIMGGNELCYSLFSLEEKFTIDSRLHERALHRFFDGITLAIGFETTSFGRDQPDFSLRADGKQLRLHNTYDAWLDVEYAIDDLLPFLPFVKNAFVMTAAICSGHEDGVDTNSTTTPDSPADLEKVTAFRFLDTLLPGLESLIICVSVQPSASNRHQYDQDLVTTSIKTLRGLSVKQKAICTSGISRGYCEWHPDTLPRLETVGMTDDEIAIDMMPPNRYNGLIFAIESD